ncbi:major centromere autoantigen B-like [Mizuhopecten yessoensis]|uniref:major centromere autoantigen B-like n=1 Tax=Mizuhopecten yessoensis TaxID=6573 RepID=UPI000B45B64E|nr:major centromere autoantigen B-like [Mizuhopecten yessoensis]
MKRKQRNTLLLVGICSANPAIAADKLSNFTFKLLPPKITSLIQPCELGIIRNLKCHYRQAVVKRVIDAIDTSVSSVTANDLSRKMTVFDAIHLLTKAWKAVTPTTIKNCFRKGRFRHPIIADTPTYEEPFQPITSNMITATFDKYVQLDYDLKTRVIPTA